MARRRELAGLLFSDGGLARQTYWLLDWLE
jgi:hypothetical protein